MKLLFQLTVVTIGLWVIDAGKSVGQRLKMGANSGTDNETLTSKEIDKIEDINVLKSHLRIKQQRLKTAEGNLEEERRVSEILGFLCACSLIRKQNFNEFIYAQKIARGEHCDKMWVAYVRESDREAAQRLRGTGQVTALLQPSEYTNFALTNCHSHGVCNKHLSCDNRTVQVLNYLKNGSSASLVEILWNEQPKYLFSDENIKYVNIYTESVGHLPYPFVEFERDEKKFTIPIIRRSTADLRQCAATLCEFVPS